MLCHFFKCLIWTTFSFFYVGFVHSQETGTLKVRFVYGGDVPDEELIQVNKDVGFCGQFRHKNERLLIDKETKAIQNVLLYVHTGRGGSKLEPVQRKPKIVTLSTINCRFEPHLLSMRAGDTLDLVNRDPIGHNTNINFFANPAIAGNRRLVEKTEPVPILVECNIHPWMRAYLIVLDHPYVDVSDEQGNIEIKDLPVGGELVFRLFHEAASGPIRMLEVDGKSLALERNMLRLKIEPGLNDLGTVVFPASTF